MPDHQLEVNVEDWGLVDYHQAVEKQLELVAKVQENPEKQYLVICSHPPVATLGRKTQKDDFSDWQGATVEVQRGGRVTYHGPNQIVIYPIVNLSQERKTLKARDLHGYLRLLENTVIDTLSEWGVSAKNLPSESFLKEQGEVEATGVWVGDQKVCSIGIGVKKWVTFHGLALNVLCDSNAFQGLRPCGFAPQVMTSLEEILGKPVDKEAAKASLVERFSEVLVKV